MATSHSDGGEYALGPTHPNTLPYATFETKAGDPTQRNDTGGGYERWRSYEYRPHTPGDAKEDVYVPVHRLCAVAWCFPDGVTAAEINLRGRDVHHTTGVEWCNVGESPNFDVPGLEVAGHGAHARGEVTDANLRAWGEDAKEQTDGPTADDGPKQCGRCGAIDATFVRSEDFDGLRCPECSRIDGGDAPMEVV